MSAHDTASRSTPGPSHSERSSTVGVARFKGSQSQPQCHQGPTPSSSFFCWVSGADFECAQYPNLARRSGEKEISLSKTFSLVREKIFALAELAEKRREKGFLSRKLEKPCSLLQNPGGSHTVGDWHFRADFRFQANFEPDWSSSQPALASEP